MIKVFTKRLMVIFSIFSFSACATFGPGGSIFSTPTSPQVYQSTIHSPKTVRLVDLLQERRVFFEMEIPAGKTLVLQFLKGHGDDSIYAPDLMKYGVFVNGEASGDLENSMSVPSSSSRMIDVFIREGLETRESDEPRLLRTDELLDEDYYINNYRNIDE